MTLTEEKIQKVEEIIDIHLCPDLDIMTRKDIKDHFKVKLILRPEADVVETADFIIDYIYEKYLGTEVQAMMYPQIVAKDPVLIMRQDIIEELKK